MSVNVNPAQLRLEMARRGWDAIDLARASRLSPATVSTALAGRPIAAKSVGLIAGALIGTPANEVIDRLVRGDSADLGFA
jgi:lambda repressor-like predicted transcriptional regulator